MEKHLYAMLAAAVSFPVSWGTIGSGSAVPRASLYRVSGVRDMHNGGLGLMRGRIQVDCYGDTYEVAIDASADIRAALEGYRGGPVLGAFLDSISDTHAGDFNLLNRVRMTFSITYRD